LGKGYPPLVAQVTDPNIVVVTGEEYEYFFFVTNTELSSEEVVDFYDKRGNCENFSKAHQT